VGNDLTLETQRMRLKTNVHSAGVLQAFAVLKPEISLFTVREQAGREGPNLDQSSGSHQTPLIPTSQQASPLSRLATLVGARGETSHAELLRVEFCRSPPCELLQAFQSPFLTSGKQYSDHRATLCNFLTASAPGLHRQLVRWV